MVTNNAKENMEAPNSYFRFPYKTSTIMTIEFEGHLTSSFITTIATCAQITTQTAAASQTWYTINNLQETTAETSIHITINDGIIAAVRHGQPMECKPEVWQWSPCQQNIIIIQ